LDVDFKVPKLEGKRMFAGKQLVLVLVVTLAVQNISFASSASDAAQPPSQITKVKAEIQKYEAKKTQVKVQLRRGSQLKGYVSRSDDTSFDITEKSGRVSKLNYEDVDIVRGGGLSRGTKIAIVVGSAIVVVAVVFAIGLRSYGY
jgi:hypothetical protein